MLVTHICRVLDSNTVHISSTTVRMQYSHTIKETFPTCMKEDSEEFRDADIFGTNINVTE